jgi:hypothetical protein
MKSIQKNDAFSIDMNLFLICTTNFEYRYIGGDSKKGLWMTLNGGAMLVSLYIYMYIYMYIHIYMYILKVSLSPLYCYLLLIIYLFSI